MTSSTASELLARLAATHNAAPPALPDALPSDLTSAGSLFAVDETWLQPLAADVTALPGALATFAGIANAAVTFADDLTALRAVLVRNAAARRPGRTQCLVVGDVDYHAAASNLTTVPMGDFAAAAATLARIAGDCALLVVEPWLPEPAAADALRALLAAARAHGVQVVCDEERTAARAAATTVHAELSLGADWTVLGPSLAGGLPFAAVVGPACSGTGRDAHPVAMAIAAAALRGNVGRVLATELARLGAAVREATARAAEREQLQVAWRGPAALPRLQFVGQEGADGSLIEHHFGLELAAVGWQLRGPLLFGSRLRSGDHTAMLAAFDRALARIRVKLVEYNSYLSGGIPYAWPGGDATLRARGVALYRYPRLAAVAVAPVPGGPGMRIDFAPGPLGDVTSSGFFLPTMFAGDVDVTARYVL
ncbi:MAG TPA: hypothetical protein VFT55_17380, partial [Planctomycetota bacterium]|nr:hypothetical protein [Planctomycetota bacterium]